MLWMTSLHDISLETLIAIHPLIHHAEEILVIIVTVIRISDQLFMSCFIQLQALKCSQVTQADSMEHGHKSRRILSRHPNPIHSDPNKV